MKKACSLGLLPLPLVEVLGVLQGDVVQGRRRLTRPERRRFLGVYLNGRRVHIDVGERWPGKINHAPPSECNVEWDAGTWQIVVTRDIQPGEQLFFDYGVGYWVDELMSKDYSKMPDDQQAFFDVVTPVFGTMPGSAVPFVNASPLHPCG